MDTEKKVKISVDTGDIESTSKRLQREATEASRQLLEDALERTNSTKDMLRYLEDEVKAMERIQSMSSKMRKMELTEKIRSDPEDKQALGEFDRAKVDEKEDKLRTEMIRDGLDEIVKTLREQMEDDKKYEHHIKSEERSTGVRGREDKLYRELAERFRDEDQSSSNRRNGAFASGMRGYGTAVIGAHNVMELGANLLQETGGMMAGAGSLKTGIALVLTGMAAKRVWGDMEKYHKSVGALYGVTGDRPPMQEYGLGLAKYGMAATDFVQSTVELAKTRRTSKGLHEAAVDQMFYTRGLGIDASQYGGVEQLSVLTGQKGRNVIQESLAAMRAAGITDGKDMAAVGDNLAIMVNLGKEQVARLGKVDTGVNTRMVAALANMDDTLKRSPEALSTMVNAVKTGLSASTSPQSDALKMAVLSRMKPNADIFDLLKMKESPFTGESVQYLPEFLKQLRKMSGNNNKRFFMNIAKEFGLSYTMSETLGSGYMNGSLGEVLDKNFSGKKGVGNIMGRARESVSFEEETAIKGANAVVASVEGLKSSVENHFNNVKSGTGYKPIKVEVTNPSTQTRSTVRNSPNL